MLKISILFMQIAEDNALSYFSRIYKMFNVNLQKMPFYRPFFKRLQKGYRAFL